MSKPIGEKVYFVRKSWLLLFVDAAAADTEQILYQCIRHIQEKLNNRGRTLSPVFRFAFALALQMERPKTPTVERRQLRNFGFVHEMCTVCRHI